MLAARSSGSLAERRLCAPAKPAAPSWPAWAASSRKRSRRREPGSRSSARRCLSILVRISR